MEKRGVSFKKQLPVVLTEKEKEQMSGDLARAAMKRGELETAKKEATSAFSAKINAENAVINVLANNIATGKEMRDVEVSWFYDYKAGMKFLIREDNGEIIQEERITEAEKQLILTEKENEKPKEKPGKNLPEKPDQDAGGNVQDQKGGGKK